MKKFLLSILAAVLVSIPVLGTAEDKTIHDRELYETLRASTAVLSWRGNEGCTATKIGPKEYLTAKHCVAGKMSHLRLEHGFNYKFVQMVMVPAHEDQDWAVLVVKDLDEEIPALELACDIKLYPGMPVAYVGHPQLNKYSYRKGYISSLDQGIPHKRWRLKQDFTIVAPAAGGASGSAIVEKETGKVIGVLIEWSEGAMRGSTVTGVETIKHLGTCGQEMPLEEGKEIVHT